VNNYEVLPAHSEGPRPSTGLAPVSAVGQEKPRRGGISAVTVVVIAAAVCIALLAFVNLAYAGETGVLQGVDTLARVQ